MVRLPDIAASEQGPVGPDIAASEQGHHDDYSLEVVSLADQVRTRKDPAEQYGAFLRRRRLEKRLTQREFGAKVGVDFTYLSKVENGRLPPPSEATISQIAKVLGDSPDDHLAQARKVPLDLRAAVAELPVEAAMLLRELRSKPVAQKAYEDMLKTLRAARATGPRSPQRRPRA